MKRVAGALTAFSAASSVLLCESPAAADGTANHVRDVRLRAVDSASGVTEIEIVGTGAPAYNVRVSDGGRRLLVDLSDADVSGAPAAITSPVGIVGGVLTQSFDTGAGRMTRLTLSLQRAASYRMVPDGNTLRVILTPVTPLGVATPPVVAQRLDPPGASVREVRFERVDSKIPGCSPNGCDRVVIDLDAVPAYSLGVASNGHPRLELRATRLPEELARTLDVTAFGGPLKSISASHDIASGSTMLDLDRATDAPGTVSVDGGKLTWSFPIPKSSVQPSPIGPLRIDGRPVSKDGGAIRRVITVAREEGPKNLPRIETSIHGGEPVVETSGGGAAGFASGAGDVLAQQRYTGRRIDIDLKDADIHNVLRLLADTGHVNVVTADDVTGTITIRMRNVPWDQVLDVVLQAKGLGMVRQGNLIRVAPMAQLQKERELKLAQQKQEYELTPLETRLIPISYAQADELQPRAKELLSPRGSIAVDERTNVLIARDIAGNLNYIEELVRSLDTQTAQVLIEARIVEATSKYLRDVGIQWGGDVTFGPATGNPTGVAFPSSTSVAGGNYDNNTPTAGLSPLTRNIATPNFAVN
ncbi:MAG: secretin and TonB N-terminal domain-containing protein, partial [Myxococcota bacterium]|nr:secretin and TonB N-terminal domain-containing protein [Myxococcota bacterium]